MEEILTREQKERLFFDKVANYAMASGGTLLLPEEIVRELHKYTKADVTTFKSNGKWVTIRVLSYKTRENDSEMIPATAMVHF